VDEEAIDPRLRFEARAFARAMADTGRESSRLTATAIDLSEVRHFLDLGGGPGSYAIEFAQRAPDLEAVIFDSAETLEVARQNVAAARLSGRIEVRAGNAFEDELGSGYDLILLSNFIHIYSPEQNRPLMGRCAAALAAGGRLAIKDFFLDPDRTSPTAAALFAVNMLVNTEAGDCYTLSEVRTWCAAAGLRFETYRELTAQSGLVIVKKPS
jgi:predicted O-methyltransferase YrrM